MNKAARPRIIAYQNGYVYMLRPERYRKNMIIILEVLHRAEDKYSNYLEFFNGPCHITKEAHRSFSSAQLLKQLGTLCEKPEPPFAAGYATYSAE